MQQILWSERLGKVRVTDKQDVPNEFKQLVHDIYMMNNCQRTDQRPNFDNWVAQALQAAYIAGQQGKSPQDLLAQMRGEPQKTRVVRRTAPAPTMVEEKPATRVVRRRTQG